MRDIVFRGKDMKGKAWHYGYLDATANKDTVVIHTDGLLPCEVQPDTVGEFTGLTDMYGKNIFEGDIVRMRAWRRERIGVVRWDDVNPSFCIKTQDDIEYDFVKCGEAELEIIGNIHDNPELINQPKPNDQ